MVPNPVIEVTGLSRRFGTIHAVRGLDLTIYSGEMFAIVGPDGAGKTTTVRMLCGVIGSTAGSATVLGYDLRKEIEAVKRRIGYLSQKFSLYGDLTVDENIQFFADIHGVRKFQARRNELLEFTRLAPFRGRLAEKLSGGMKQKLALACTLIHTPDIIFLDEPTTGVDPVSRRDFWKILSNLLSTGITIVLTTPYLDEAERCSRVGMMNEGRLMVVDTPGNVKRLMRGVILEIVCDDVSRAASILRAETRFREVQAFGDRLNVVVDDMKADEQAAQVCLQAKGVDIRQIRVVPPSLENVFISILKSGGAA